MTRRSFGNGLRETRSYDLQGRLLSQTLSQPPGGGVQAPSIDSRSYAYDANGNLLSRSGSAQTGTYAYDRLDRLISDAVNAGAPSPSQPPSQAEYQYDLNHNRQSKNHTGPIIGSGQNQTGTEEQYFYAPESNRLQLVEISKTTGPALENRPGQTMGYNHANRQAELYEAGDLKAGYIYNANGQRTRKVTPDAENGSTTIYHYDLNGMLIGETTAAGEPIRDYLWQDGIPLAQIDRRAGNDTVHYLHTDHLMTPRLATNQSWQITWRWEGEAFGETDAREDIDGDGNTTTINLRFPGQYYDKETGLHYNWFRDYNPHTGRYRQSDLIGLAGGMNTYGYVYQNPLMYIDPDGKVANEIGALTGVAIGAAAGYVIGAGIGAMNGMDIHETGTAVATMTTLGIACNLVFVSRAAAVTCMAIDVLTVGAIVAPSTTNAAEPTNSDDPGDPGGDGMPNLDPNSSQGDGNTTGDVSDDDYNIFCQLNPNAPNCKKPPDNCS